VTLTEVLPDLSTNIEIVGPGADQFTVTRPDTAENFRIFTVTGDTTVVTISGMTISKGNTLEVDDDRGGGGILNDGAATLTITDSIISGNTGSRGGGIRNFGTLTITNSTIGTSDSPNTATAEGGAIRNDGTLVVSNSTLSANFSNGRAGAIHNEGFLDVTNSTFSGNRADGGDGGGAIFNKCTLDDDSNCIEGTGEVTVTGSTFSGNSAGISGGAINNQRTLTVTNSTFSGNRAPDGGGIYNRGGAATVNNSTFSDNRANLRGGGIFPDTTFFGETTTITNSTISGNIAQTSGGGVYNNDGLTEIEFSTITKNTAPNDQGSGVASVGNDRTSTEVLSSIISANTNTDVDFVNDTTNTFVSNGYNLIGDGNATGAFNQTGDQTGVADPGLDPLNSYGGPTQTHRLQSDSPAIDAGPPTDGDPTACPPPDTDQRGVSRPQGSTCDIGSFELEKPPDTTAPKVISTFPRNGGEVGPAANIRATFSEDMLEDSVINAFKLFRKGSTNQIDAVVTYNAATDIATLNPTNNLRRGVTYKAVVTTVAEDMAGNQLDQNDSRGGLQQKVWFFEIDN
jgi:Bacterial Ig-like domain